MNVYGYARVSTLIQDLDVQIDQIKKYCKYKDFDLIRIYTDKASGKNLEREGFQEMLSMIKTKNNPLNIGAIVVYRMDRISRSTRDMINLAADLQELNVQFVSLTENIDTTTKEGRFFTHLMSAFAELERNTIADRIADGKAAARAKGVKFGRKPVDIPIKEICLQIDKLGVPLSRLAKKHGVCRATIYNKIKEYEENQNKQISENYLSDKSE